MNQKKLEQNMIYQLGLNQVFEGVGNMIKVVEKVINSTQKLGNTPEEVQKEE